MKVNKYIKTFEAYGINYSVENWSDYLTNIITKLSPSKIDEEKSGNIFSLSIPIKSEKDNIERYFTKESFYRFPVKNIQLNFKINLTDKQYSTKINQASFAGYDKDLILNNFTFFNFNQSMLTMDKMELSFHITCNKTTWEMYYNNPKEFWKKYPDLTSLLYHEVHHAYEEYEMKAKGFNPAKTNDSKIDITIRNIWDEFPDMMILTKFVYLLTSHEINARIAQLYGLLKREDIKNIDDFHTKVKKSDVWHDYLVLKNYEPTDYINAFKHSFTKDDEAKFLSLWNKYNNNNIPNFKTIEDFFNYWKPITKNKSDKIRNKILKIWTLIKN